TQHSREMGADGYFGHASADGQAFWRRIGAYYSSAWGVWSVGENLLWSAPPVGASRALRMWIHSPEHLAILLTPRWREVGISAVHVVGAPGFFRGRNVMIVTTDFGVRS
ncbi:MAG TPA: CAP domain-containing protein, partial [Gaiellaceae bacterium]|nr:CAP domain-containing protein [Gaiellaceae bacterium]